ncbi:MAG: enolase C-terminal domain-like protein [Candidatus Bathyarchaeia archaeon]
MGSVSMIKAVHARKIFNSRGEETVEVEVETLSGKGRAAAPTGASRGKHEVAYYPEGGVDKSIDIIEKVVAPRLLGVNSDSQEAVDNALHEVDGTEDFRRIGGNASYAVSVAAAAAAASSHGIPLFRSLIKTQPLLPHPLGNVIGGGKHAGRGAPDIQEFLVLPWRAETFSDAYKAMVKVHRAVGERLEKVDLTFTRGKGDEGAWAPRIHNHAALDVLVEAAERVSSESGVDVRVGLDVAASTLWVEERRVYNYVGEGVTRDEGEQVDYIKSLIEKFKLVYVEDPVHEDDFGGFAELTRSAKGCLICGDDLFVTNVNRLRKGIEEGAANAIIIKPNQIGTISDAYKAVELADKHGYKAVTSHRSGDTCDEHLAHLTVAFGCPIIKTGIVGGERVAKLNELLRIEETLKGRSPDGGTGKTTLINLS